MVMGNHLGSRTSCQLVVLFAERGSVIYGDNGTDEVDQDQINASVQNARMWFLLCFQISYLFSSIIILMMDEEYDNQRNDNHWTIH